MRRHAGSVYVAAAGLWTIGANDAKAQAWVLPRGEGDISFTYQRIDNTGHRRTNGFLVPRGRSVDMSFYLEAECAFTSHFSVTAGLPYVLAKYTDPNPPPSPIPFLPEDRCRSLAIGLARLRNYRAFQPGWRCIWSFCPDTICVGRSAKSGLQFPR